MNSSARLVGEGFISSLLAGGFTKNAYAVNSQPVVTLRILLNTY